MIVAAAGRKAALLRHVARHANITDDAQPAEDDLLERVDSLTYDALRALPRHPDRHGR